jgi:hypothetical protein
MKDALTPSVATDLVLSTTHTFILCTLTTLISIPSITTAFSATLVIISTVAVGTLTAGCPLGMTQSWSSIAAAKKAYVAKPACHVTAGGAILVAEFWRDGTAADFSGWATTTTGLADRKLVGATFSVVALS